MTDTTGGIDLATQPKKTGAVLITWDGERAADAQFIASPDDDALVELILAADVTGIDVPLGWPIDFVKALNEHHAGGSMVPQGEDAHEWRNRVVLRETDRFIWESAQKRPLSVAADRIALTAMRMSGIEARVKSSGVDYDRSGTGGSKVVEVYPAASLKQMGLDHGKYKKSTSGSAPVRRRIVEGLRGWMLPERDDVWDRCVAQDDVLDAVVSAITARAVSLGRTRPIPPAAMDAASVEGWIHIPDNWPVAA